MNKIVTINNTIQVSNNSQQKLVIAGPCQLENLDHSMFMCEKLQDIANKHKFSFVFKGSFDKANRTSINSKRGVGIDKGVKIFEAIKKEFGVATITDVHEAFHCDIVKDCIDIIQIPAFLCRQTSLIEAAAKTGKVVNVKKGQFLAPWDMKHVAAKAESFNCDKIMLTERGTSFGYGTLVSDMSGLEIMKESGYPVIFDATHSSQKPSALGAVSGGDRKVGMLLGRAAFASTQIAGIFAEVHQDPDNAPSDGPNMLTPDMFDTLLSQINTINTIWS